MEQLFDGTSKLGFHFGIQFSLVLYSLFCEWLWKKTLYMYIYIYAKYDTNYLEFIDNFLVFYDELSSGFSV